MQTDLDNAGRNVKNPAIANGKRAQVMAKWLGTEVKYRDPGSKAVKPETAVAVDSAAVTGPVKL